MCFLALTPLAVAGALSMSEPGLVHRAGAAPAERDSSATAGQPSTAAAIPERTKSDAAAPALSEPRPLRVALWTYGARPLERENILSILNGITTPPLQIARIDESSAEAIQAVLPAADIFIIPEQENGDGTLIKSLGPKVKSALQKFVRRGGRVISLCPWNGVVELLGGAGLLQMSSLGAVSAGAFDVKASSPLTAGLPDQLKALEPTGRYRLEQKDARALVTSGDDAIVALRSLDRGKVILIGYDYSRLDPTVNQLLINAVLWPAGGQEAKK